MKDRAYELNDRRRNIYWQRTVKKYGCNVHILCYWETEKEAFEHEKFLIDCFRSINHPLVNLTNGGDGSGGYRWTSEQKAKINNSGSFNPMYGKLHTEETKKKIAYKAKGKTLTDEHKSKISQKLKNRKFSEEHKQKLSALNKGGNNPASKKCKVFGIVYDSATQAANSLGVSKHEISRKCRSSKYSEYIYLN